MMKRIHAVVAGALAGVALTVAAVTYAQPFAGVGPGVGHGFGPGMGMEPGHRPIAGVDPAAIDSRLGDLKAQLKITPAQESAWQAYIGAAKQQAASMQALRAQMQEGTGTAPERMGQRTELMQQRSAAMSTMTNAFNALYAVLTPEQKAIADQHRGPMAHRGMPFAGHAS
jgi:Spy/CpxP family protein refolding chaperone